MAKNPSDKFLNNTLKELWDVSSPLKPKPKTQEEKEQKEKVQLYLLLALMSLTGSEPFKVILRKNIGKSALSIWRLLISSLLFLAYGGIVIHLAYFEKYSILDGEYKIAFVGIGCFYILLGLAVIILGMQENDKASERYKTNPQNHLYRGDSIFFLSAIQKGVSRENIWSVREPFSCFAFGILLSAIPALIDPVLAIAGLPIIFTSIPFWINELLQEGNAFGIQDEKITNEAVNRAQQQATKNNDDFDEVT